MGKVILDAETRAKLGGVLDRVELYDEEGNLLGYCTPVDAHLHEVDLPGPDPFSDDQVAAVLGQPDPGRPLADILRDLRNQ